MGTREIMEGTEAIILERVDVTTGLPPLMAAAVAATNKGKKIKNSYDLTSVYHLIKKSPKMVAK